MLFIIFKGFSLKLIKEFFLEGESPTLKCQREEVFKLIKDTIDEDVSSESFNKMLTLLIECNSMKRNCVSNRECLSLTKTVANNTNNYSDFEVFRKNLVKEFNDLKNNFFGKVNFTRIELLTKYESNTNNKNNGLERLLTHLLDQTSFLKDQLKTKDEMINILVTEQMSKRDEAPLQFKEQFHNEQKSITPIACTTKEQLHHKQLSVTQ